MRHTRRGRRAFRGGHEMRGYGRGRHRVRRGEGRKVYSLTEAGKEAAPEQTDEARPWEEGDEDSPRFALRQELFRTMGAAKQVARGDDEEQLTKAAEILKDTR